MKKNIFGFIAAGSMSMILFGCSATGQNVQSTEKVLWKQCRKQKWMEKKWIMVRIWI